MRITIVGAGPIGCYLGQLLQCYGFSPLLLEEHPEIGVPKHCAGLVGSSFFDNSIIPLPREIIKRGLNGAIISYQDQRFILRTKGVAFVIGREALDKKLSKGLEIRKETRVLNLKKRGEAYLLHTNKGTVYSDVVIGADGATSTVRKAGDFKLHPIYYKGIQFKIKQPITPGDMVQVDFSKPFLHFCWLIPEDEGTIRVGSFSPHDPLTTLKQFMEKINVHGKVIEKMGGVLSIGYGETLKDAIALVGDAACQVKPLSGGGLYYGMRCAEILADCIRAGKLSSYDTEWKKQMGGEIRSALRIRNYLEKRSLSFLERLFGVAHKNPHLIEQVADFEHHSLGVFAVVKKVGLALPGLLIKPPTRKNFP